MLETLTDKFSTLFHKLRGKRLLGREDIEETLRRIRMILLESDVALPVLKTFLSNTQEKLIGKDLLKGLDPSQQIIHAIHEALLALLIHPESFPPSFKGAVMLVGLQGSGKTTFTAKLAAWLMHTRQAKVLMASLDNHRPAAQQQLMLLGEKIRCPVLPWEKERLSPIELGNNALDAYKKGNYDVLLLDTAGRLHSDTPFLNELQTLYSRLTPHLTLFVADAMTGQDAVRSAKAFHHAVPLSGVVLSRADGDTRGGCALSITYTTQRPIWFLSTGEKVEALEAFDPKRMADRILGMGDIVGFVEKFKTEHSETHMKRFEQSIKTGRFTFKDLEANLLQIQKMGTPASWIGMLPGMGSMVSALKEKGPMMEKQVKQQIAIIRAMTPKERANPTLLNGARKRRIAKGSGVSLPLINQLIKQHSMMGQIMKQSFGIQGKKRGFLQNFFSRKPHR